MEKSIHLIVSIILLLFISGCTQYDSDPLLFETENNPISKIEIMALEGNSLQQEPDGPGILRAEMHTISVRGSFNLKSGPIPVGGKIVQLHVTGDGNVMHMGRTNLVMEKEVITNDPPPWEASAKVVLLTANGDELYFTYWSGLVDLSNTPVFTFKAECEITGGTGKYKNATGTINYHENFNWLESEGILNITGTISY